MSGEWVIRFLPDGKDFMGERWSSHFSIFHKSGLSIQ